MLLKLFKMVENNNGNLQLFTPILLKNNLLQIDMMN